MEQNLKALMVIKSFGSSSKGNSILIDDLILLDAGVSPSKIHPKPKIVFVSHRHGDHMKYAKDWMKRGLRVHSGEIEPSAFGKMMNVWDKVDFQDYEITATPALHDTENTLNFIVDYKGKRLLYEVDNAKRTYEIEGVTHYIAECNWDEATLAANNLDEYRVKRLRATHKSLEILLEELEEMDKSELEEVWLAHMSETNLDKEFAREKVQELVGVPVYFA